MRTARALTIAALVICGLSAGCSSTTWSPGTDPEVTATRFAEALAQGKGSKACNLITYDGVTPLPKDKEHQQEYTECRKGLLDTTEAASPAAQVGKPTVKAIQSSSGKATVGVAFPDSDDADFREGLMVPVVEIDGYWYVDANFYAGDSDT